MKKGDSSRPRGPASAPALESAVAAVARLRVENALTRTLIYFAAAFVLALVIGHWLPLAWAVLMAGLMAVESNWAKRLLAAAHAGEEPKIGGYASWTFVQSLVGNGLAVIAWFMEPRHGDALAVFLLMGGAVNALLTLRASNLLFLCGVSATALTAAIVPVVDFFVRGQGRFMTDLAPMLAIALMALYGYAMWRSLRTADAANRRALDAASRIQESSRQAVEARADFVGIMRHEVRTPMTALTGSAEVLRRLSLPPEARVQVDALIEASEVLAAVLDDLVDLDAIESGRLAIQKRPTDPRNLVKSVVNAFRPQAEDKGLELFFDIAENAPKEVLIDPVRVRQILFNLTSNAVKFTQSGGVRVRLQAAPSEKPGHVRLGVAVADTGVGMSRADLALHLGERRAANGKRTGLGLAISAKLARLMGAKLAAKSTPGQGSMFSLVIEAEIARAAERSVREAVRYLVVTHSSQERRLIAAALDQTNAQFEMAESSARALEMLHEARYDLVIADQRLPELDAIDIAGMLRTGGPNAGTPLLALVENEGDAAMARECGCDGAVLLPLTPTALLDECARVLGGAPSGATRAA